MKLGEGLHQTEDTVDGKLVTRYHSFDADGVCTDKEIGYTGYFTSDGTAVEDLPKDDKELDTTEYYYVEAGILHPGWLFFNKEGEATSPDDTKPEVSENPDENNGMPDEDQQQAILDMKAYHVGEDGRVHRVTATDTRKCVESGYSAPSATPPSTVKNSGGRATTGISMRTAPAYVKNAARKARISAKQR